MKKLLLAALLAAQAHAVIILDATTKILEVTTSAAVNTDYSCSWTDTTTSAFTPGETNGQITTATTTTVVAAPASSTQRRIYNCAISNVGTAAQTVTVKMDISGTERRLSPAISLAAGETLMYDDGAGWYVLDIAGRWKTQASELTGTSGVTFPLLKIGTAPEAAGQWYSWSKDSGQPGAWAVGSPGLSGRTTDGTTTTDAGCLPIKTPATGNNYFANMNMVGSVVHNFQFWDVLWVNTGTAVTTTTGQTVNSVTFPARDIEGSTNGVGVQVAILVTTATTNAGAVTNTTLTYTNDAGTGSRTATIASFPATAVIGTVVPFQLAGGDTGVRSIQTLTLGTSYGGGAISLIAYRPVLGQPMTLANVGSPAAWPPMNPGVRLYTGACLLPFGLMSATTATNVYGTATVLVR